VSLECRSAKSAMGWRQVSLSMGFHLLPWQHGFICSFEHHFFFIYDFIIIFLLRASQSSSTIGISYIKAVTTIGNSYR
jgi:hypothetical protein